MDHIRRAGLCLAALMLIIATSSLVSAQTVSIDLMGGTAYNLPTPLTIRQAGFPDIRFTAHYDTKPLGPYAPYYSWRVDVWGSHGAWEFQQIHHRLFLTNTTPEVTRFTIHFGYNYFLAGRAWRTHGFVAHLGGGVIVPNPDNIVRGQSLNANAHALDVGYRLGGVGGAAALSRDLRLASHVYALVDGGLVFGRASVPVVDGSASVPNVAFHGHVGIGFVF
jgi:hypothetical protein